MKTSALLALFATVQAAKEVSDFVQDLDQEAVVNERGFGVLSIRTRASIVLLLADHKAVLGFLRGQNAKPVWHR